MGDWEKADDWEKAYAKSSVFSFVQWRIDWEWRHMVAAVEAFCKDYKIDAKVKYEDGEWLVQYNGTYMVLQDGDVLTSGNGDLMIINRGRFEENYTIVCNED